MKLEDVCLCGSETCMSAFFVKLKLSGNPVTWEELKRYVKENKK